MSIGYAVVGSGSGIAAFSAKQADFGASDVPMTSAEQSAARGGSVTQVPVALGGEGVAYNLNLRAGPICWANRDSTEAPHVLMPRSWCWPVLGFRVFQGWCPWPVGIL